MSDIDFHTFNKIKERMKSKFPILLGGYLSDAKKYQDRIRANIPSGDINDLIEAVHSFKSASGLLGLINVHLAAQTLEYAGKGLKEKGESNFESLGALYDELNNAFSTVEDILNSELDKSKEA